ncbi:unnamed protein product [Prorocentrum cordatum]|uniref:Calmodulin n=1 Tax=Prorocentrum cordatum TaxID=2364126 RepID=A0ABN9Q384_9DINO|nr:unnamed protein product [Polarella glacialis]
MGRTRGLFTSAARAEIPLVLSPQLPEEFTAQKGPWSATPLISAEWAAAVSRGGAPECVDDLSEVKPAQRFGPRVRGTQPALALGDAIVGVTDAELKRAQGTVAPAIAWAQAPRHSIAKPERAAFSFKDLCSMWREKAGYFCLGHCPLRQEPDSVGRRLFERQRAETSQAVEQLQRAGIEHAGRLSLDARARRRGAGLLQRARSSGRPLVGRCAVRGQARSGARPAHTRAGSVHRVHWREDACRAGKVHRAGPGRPGPSPPRRRPAGGVREAARARWRCPGGRWRGEEVRQAPQRRPRQPRGGRAAAVANDRRPPERGRENAGAARRAAAAAAPRLRAVAFKVGALVAGFWPLALQLGEFADLRAAGRVGSRPRPLLAEPARLHPGGPRGQRGRPLAQEGCAWAAEVAPRGAAGARGAPPRLAAGAAPAVAGSAGAPAPRGATLRRQPPAVRQARHQVELRLAAGLGRGAFPPSAHADGGIPVVRQHSKARAAARGFAQAVARAASRRVGAREAARELLPHVSDEPADGPPRICIFFGSEGVVSSAREMAGALAAAIAPLGERGLVLLAGEPSLTEAFGLAYGQSSHGIPLWSVLPDHVRSTLPGSVDQDVFAQLGDLYFTLGSGPDVEEVAAAAAARGASLLPLAHDAAGLFFTSLASWEQLERSGLSVAEAASLAAAALEAFLRTREALQQVDVDTIEFDIEGRSHAAKIVERSALTTPAPPGSTHLLAHFRRPDADSWAEWVTLDTRAQLLINIFRHEDIPYRVVTDLVRAPEACLARKVSHRASVSTVWDAQRFMTDSQSLKQLSVTRELDFDPAVMKVFKTLSVHGEILTDHLSEACSQLGHWMINQEWIEDLVRSQFNSVAFLDRREFAVFAGKYQELFMSCMSERFSSVDRRNVGRLGQAEVAQFLRNMGITPVKGVVEEFMAEVCNNKQRTPLDFDQFAILNRIVWERAGFTLSEADVLVRDILARFPALACTDLGEDGLEELRLCTKWLGFPASIKHWEVPQEIRLEDGPPSAAPRGRDFLVLMRALREQWVKAVRGAFSSHDQGEAGESSQDGNLEPSELQNFVGQVGFVAPPEALYEAVQDCRLGGKAGLLFEDVYDILDTMRRQDCFTRSDLEDVRQSYRKYSNGGSAGLTGMPLSCALRQAGWALPVTKVQDMIPHFDFDKSDDICEVEFVKLVRRLRENLIEALEKHYDGNQLHWPGRITEKEFRSAVARHLHCRLNVRQLMQVWDEHSSKFHGTADRWDWVRLVLDYWRAARDKSRENHGFDEEDVRAFQVQFSRHDRGTGVITLADRSLTNLLDEAFPEMRRNNDDYKKVARWLSEVEQSNDGAIDFPEFLRMMRQMEDDADEELLALEEDARITTGLSRDEVKEFRAIFSSFDCDNSGLMSYGELRYLLGKLVHVDEGSGAGGALRAALAEVDEDGNKELSFPEFLRLMKKLQSDNWNGINAAAKEVSERSVQRLEETTPTARRKNSKMDWHAIIGD